MSTQTFPVTGLTCGHCVGAVTSELSTLPGVTDVQIDLVGGGTSTLSVTADTALTDSEVAAVLDEAGSYQLVTS
jgi:copper chaperone CopZ